MSDGTVLVINSGSSSIKFQLVHPDTAESVAHGLIERIGEPDGHIVYNHRTGVEDRSLPIADHRAGLKMVLDIVAEVGRPLSEAGIIAVGHRVVHGGDIFYSPTLIDDGVVKAIADLSNLAPLHNPANVIGIEVAREELPDVPHVAVFDTAFFHTLPAAASTYAIDRDVAKANQIRRYGFHGTSHEYVSGRVAEFLGKDPAELNQIVLHLGNGASASAIKGGKAIDTTMGLTPLEGLVMGTRSGDIDPGIILHLNRNSGMKVDEIDDLLNRRSGLKGLSGVNDTTFTYTCSVSTSVPSSFNSVASTSSPSPAVLARTTSTYDATAWPGFPVSVSRSIRLSTRRRVATSVVSPHPRRPSRCWWSPPTRSWRSPARRRLWWPHCRFLQHCKPRGVRQKLLRGRTAFARSTRA